MYIDFELTNANMIFRLRDESGILIRTDTYPNETHLIYAQEVLETREIIVRLHGEDYKRSWPPAGSYPRERIVFINSASVPFGAGV